MSTYYQITTMLCVECGKAYKGGPKSHFCPKCRGKRIGDACRRRGLHQLGAQARAKREKE